jgi:HlyD family secretion protein
MSRIIEHAAPAQAVVPVAKPAAMPAVRRRPRRWSAEAATESAWLRDGFTAPEPDLEDFLAEAPSTLLCNTHRVAAVLFIAMGVLAAILKVDIIIAGGGRLAVDSPTIVLQPMELAVIRELRVKPGDVVHKGDILAALDPTFAQADRAALLVQQRAQRAQQLRLEAELDEKPLVLESSSPELLLESTLYQQRQAQRAGRLEDFDQKIEGGEAEIAAAEAKRVSLAHQLEVAKEVEMMRNALFRSQTGSRLNYLESQAARLRTERELQAAAADLKGLDHAMRSLRGERQQFLDGWRRELLEALVKLRSESLALEESLAKANRLNDLVVLAAPEDGLVLEVAKRSVGSILHAAEPLITMIPSDASLIAEISIGSADVGYAKAGDEVAVKVDAFPYQKHGMLMGRLRSIGADSFTANGGGVSTPGAYHRGQVVLIEPKLQAMPAGAHLIPGMTLSAEIKVGTRSVISYLIYPIVRGFGESIREP